MKLLKVYLPLLLGAIILFMANTESLQSPVMYIIGIIMFMFGLYNVSSTIRGKSDKDDNNDD